MQHDDVIWGIINRRNCAFKLTSETQKFCRNEFNVTGLCMRKACPLANSQYATVREHKGKVYLYIRQPANVHTPHLEWMRVKLSKNFIEALQQIEDNLVFWPLYYKQKCRQRFLKITQYLARMRKIKLTSHKKVVPIRKKDERRIARREEKALIAAKLDNEIEKQLLSRLKEGTYERIYNFPKRAFDVRLEGEELDMDEEVEEELEALQTEKEGVEVKEEVPEEEELREELERGLVRMERAEDSDDESDIEDSDLEGVEVDSDDLEGAGEESEDDEAGQVEYVADLEESDEEGDEQDIEDAADRLGLRDLEEAGPAQPSTSKGIPVVKKRKLYATEEEQNAIKEQKYAPKLLTGSQRKKIIKKKAKQRLQDLIEKDKAAKQKQKSRIRVRK